MFCSGFWECSRNVELVETVFLELTIFPNSKIFVLFGDLGWIWVASRVDLGRIWDPVQDPAGPVPARFRIRSGIRLWPDSKANSP